LKSRGEHALVALRLVVAALLFIHGTFRLFSGGVAPFGEFLAGQHFPQGPALAWGITLVEIVGTVVLASGFAIRPLALYFAAELVIGVILVHRHDGWFVVGGGRNGMEFSALLISSLLILAWATPSRE
jgi:putative oxidoreductase